MDGSHVDLPGNLGVDMVQQAVACVWLAKFEFVRHYNLANC